MKIGILMCGHAADEVQEIHGDFDRYFQQLLAGNGLDFRVYDVENMQFPGSVTDCDGWLLTGSKHGVYEDHAFIEPLAEFVRGARDAKMPMVGICFGHQMIAYALGGHVEKYDGGWAVGRHKYKTSDGQDWVLNAWHQDQVMKPPAEAKTTASSDFCQHAALVYPDGIWTIQAHPEMSKEILHDYLALRGPVAGVPQDLMDVALSDDRPLDDKQTGQRIAQFFLQHAKVNHV